MDPLPNIGPEAFCSFPIHAREAGNFWKESVDSDPFRASRKKLGRPATLTPGYRPDIDGLRAISILLVVAFHACPAIVTGGFIGVDVFFVISGFLITGIILRQTAAGTFSLATFYSRRVRRIFPALIMVMAITYVIGWVVLLPRDFAMLGDNMVAGTAFASNLFQLRSLDYFAPDAAFNPLLHLWSLGIEEQFYIFWPIILVLLKPGRPVLVAICGIGMASFAINLAYVWGHHAPGSFLFAAGKGVGVDCRRGAGLPAGLGDTASAAFLARRARFSRAAVDRRSRVAAERQVSLSGLERVTAGDRSCSPDQRPRLSHLCRTVLKATGGNRPDQLSTLPLALAVAIIPGHYTG